MGQCVHVWQGFMAGSQTMVAMSSPSGHPGSDTAHHKGVVCTLGPGAAMGEAGARWAAHRQTQSELIALHGVLPAPKHAATTAGWCQSQ